MSKFSVGDSVKVYGASIYRNRMCNGEKGTVVTPIEHRENCLDVDFGDNTGNWSFHHKQLRKYIIRKRREVWINEYEENGRAWLNAAYHTTETIALFHRAGKNYKRTIRFVEARDKNDNK